VAGSTARLASTRVPVAAPGEPVGRLLEDLRGRDYDSVAVTAVCEGERLVGLVTMERLLKAGPGTAVSEVMDPDPPVVRPDTSQERAAWEAVHQGAVLAVVDERGRFAGLLQPQRLLEVLLEEHTEDMARLGGFTATENSARTASTENVSRRLWHRLPWLLVGLIGALGSALVVGSFESQLERTVLIAFFVPGVVYIADAVGTQTEALVIRGLSVGVPVARMAVRELITGVLLGALLSTLAWPLIMLVWRDAAVALAVSVSLFAASSIATLVAMALPWAINRLGRDPAFGSGPLATVVQDLLSVVIYFATATVIVT
jgi:magnesium transporter